MSGGACAGGRGCNETVNGDINGGWTCHAVTCRSIAADGSRLGKRRNHGRGPSGRVRVGLGGVTAQGGGVHPRPGRGGLAGRVFEPLLVGCGGPNTASATGITATKHHLGSHQPLTGVAAPGTRRSRVVEGAVRRRERPRRRATAERSLSYRATATPDQHCDRRATFVPPGTTCRHLHGLGTPITWRCSRSSTPRGA